MRIKHIRKPYPWHKRGILGFKYKKIYTISASKADDSPDSDIGVQIQFLMSRKEYRRQAIKGNLPGKEWLTK